MEPKVERDCNTCTWHTQAIRSVAEEPPHCWDCKATTSLIHWEPIKDFPPLTPTEYAKLHLEDETNKSALSTQVGGDHYKKLKIQPMEYSMANKLDACQHTAIKYVTRFRDKGGKQDLEKAVHAIEMLIEHEYGDIKN